MSVLCIYVVCNGFLFFVCLGQNRNLIFGDCAVVTGLYCLCVCACVWCKVGSELGRSWECALSWLYEPITALCMYTNIRHKTSGPSSSQPRAVPHPSHRYRWSQHMYISICLLPNVSLHGYTTFYLSVDRHLGVSTLGLLSTATLTATYLIPYRWLSLFPGSVPRSGIVDLYVNFTFHL